MERMVSAEANRTGRSTEASLNPPKLLFQLAKVHFDQRRPSVRTCVGHLALLEIADQIFQFTAREIIVGLDRVAADGFRDRVLAQPQ